VADPFETLGVKPAFDLDLGALEKRHRELSRALHPDRYAGRPPGERRQALGRAIEVNEAWRQLSDPIRRAEALLQRSGVKVGEGAEPKADPVLLMEMMEQREALADARRARDQAALEKLADGIRKREASVLTRLGAGFKSQATGDDLLRQLGELRYYRRFLQEAAAIEDELF